MEPQDLQERKTGMNLWKRLIQQKDLPPAVYSYWIMLSTSSVTRVWKHQNPLCNLPLSAQYKDLACSLHLLPHVDSTWSPKKDTPSPRWALGLTWTNTGRHNLVPFGLHFGTEAELALNMFSCESLLAWRKLLPQPSAWPDLVSSCHSRYKTKLRLQI